MPTETTGQDAQPVSETQPEVKSNTIDSLPEWAQTLIRETRSEAAARRKQLAEQEAASKAALEARLVEDKKWQELAEQYKRELEGLQPYKAQVDAMREALEETVRARVDRLPEDMRPLVPQYDDPRLTLQWLNANEARLTRPNAPQMDAGARGDAGKSSVKLTAEQEQMLAMIQRTDPKMTRERYIARLITMQAGGN